MGLTNWISGVIGAIAAGALAFLLHTVDVDRIKASDASKLADQKAAMTKSCDDDKAITKGTQDALQKNLDIVSAKLASAKRVRPASCVPVITGKADLAAIPGEHAGQNGISAKFDATASGLTSDWLRDYAAQCETIRQVEMSCDKFTDDERK